MTIKLHIPALWLDAAVFTPFLKKESRCAIFPALLLLFSALTATANPAHTHLGVKNSNHPALAPTLTLEASGPASAACGDLVTINITAISGFTDIGSLQHSVNWDETQLMYVSHTATQIGGVGGDPLVGTGNTAAGELTYSWVDPSGLDGEDLGDGTVLMTITLEVIANGGTASVDITGTPLSIEVADNLLDVGTVIVQNNVSIALGPIVVTCPADFSVCIDAAVVTLTGESPSGGTYSGTGVTGNQFDPATAGVGPHIITYSYTDGGCSNSCTFTATVNALPVVTLNDPADVCTDGADMNFTGTPANGVFTTTAGAGLTDNGDGTAVLDVSTAGAGTYDVTYTFTDLNGCSASQTVSVTILAAPVVTCPTNLTICTGAAAFVLTGESPLGGTYSGTGVSAGSFDPVAAGPGTYTITYSYTDGNGCTAECTFDITVEDLTPPVINCPVTVVTENADAACEYVVIGTGLDATATDNCVLASLVNDYNGSATLENAVFNPGNTVVIWTATDAGGLTSTCSIDVTITDADDPTITCPADLTVDTDPGNCDAVVNGLTPTVTDNCPVITTWSVTAGPALAGLGTSTASDASGAVFALGTTTIEYLVTDVGANTATCSFSVTVEDNEMFVVTPLPPGLVTFQDTFNVNTAPGTCSQNVSWYRASFLTHSATDNCPDMFTITEGEAVVNGTPDPNFFTNNGVTPFPYDYTNPLHQVTPVSAAFPVGTTVIPYYFIDIHSDTVTIVVVVNVAEIEPPTATCVSGIITLPLDGTGNAVLLPNAVDNGSSDNCGIADITVAPSAFTCADVAVNQTVVLTVTDIAGNTDTCSATVDVVDGTSPLLICPFDRILAAGVACDTSDVTLGMVAETDINDLGPGEFYDNAGACGAGQYTVTYSIDGGPSNPIAGLATQLFIPGTVNVTITVESPSGVPASCNFTVTVEDETPPKINCPNPPPVNTNLGGCLALVGWNPPTFTDNCPGTINVTSTHLPNTIFLFGTTTVTYTATDVAGNAGTCSFNVVVNDIQPPVANCQDISVSLDANGIVTVMPAQLDNNSTDNCFYDYVNADSIYNCTDMGANPYTLVIEDAGGLTATKTCTVTVLDNTPVVKDPVITNCNVFTPIEVDLDANCSGTLDAAVFALNFTITDNTLNSIPFCPLTFDIEVDGGGFAPVYQWNCADIGTNTVTFRATDKFGNTAVCTKTITVNDVTPPIIVDANTIAPPAVTVECDVYDPNDFATLGQITLADVTDACDDACDDAITISFADVTTAGACDNASTVTRTWTVTDQAGNALTYVQVFSVVDTEAPEIIGVQTTINLEANDTETFPTCAAPFTVQLINSNVVDNCTPSLLSEYDIFYEIQFPVGFIPSTPAVNGGVTENFPIGTSLVTFTVVDPCNNSTQVTFTVNVEDVDGPVTNEPFGAFFGNTLSICGETLSILNATGNCGNNFSWYRPFRNVNEESFMDCSAYTVTETISDPTVQSAIAASSPFVYNNPPIFSIFPTTFFPVGSTVVTYTAVSGNDTTICSFTVQILDDQPPTIACPSNQELSISSACSNASTVPSYLNGVQVTDNCPNNVVLEQNPPAGTALLGVVDTVKAGKIFTITVTAQDSFPNSLPATPCTFTVTLTDDEAPVPDVPILPAITSFCGVDTIDAPSASDCDGGMFVTIYGTPSVTVLAILPPLVPGGPPRYVIPSGNYAITWSYTDDENNTTTQLQSVQLLPDINPPLAICASAFSVELNAAGEYLLSLPEVDSGSTDPDNCGPVTLTLNPAVLTCANLNTPVNVQLLVEDVAGNEAQCITTVTVLDVTAPVLSPIPANTTLEACENIPSPAAITATDVCDANVSIVYVQDTTSFSNAYKYIIRRTWTATDDSGNTTTGIQTIAIQDTEAPVIAAAVPDTIFVFTDENNLNCMDTVSFDIEPFVDDCDSTTLVITNDRTTQGADYSEILGLGTYSLVFTATDGNDNVATRAIVLVVQDGTDPIAACINGVSVSLQASGTVTITPANVDANSTDNCTDQIDLELTIQRLDPPGTVGGSITFGCADADGVTQHPVRLYVKDEAGNESTCETFIVVQDNVFPTITACPPSKTVQCSDDLSPDVQGTPTATDNCTIGSVEFSDSTATGSGNVCLVIVRTWQVLDQASNAVTCVQLLSVQDTVKPVFTVLPPANDTLLCSDTLAVASLLGATDNCDDSVTITIAVDTINVAQGACGLFRYTVSRTWTATDNCGNTSVVTQELTVTDTIAPQFSGLPDTLTLLTADFPPNVTCLVPLSLNIGQYLSDCSPDSMLTVTNDAPQGDGELDISGDYTAGTYLVKFTATDACNNVSADSIVIQIIDNSIPTVICNDKVVISLGTNGQATVSTGSVDLGSTDNCGIETMFLSDSTFDCGNIGINPVTLTVVDVNGNSNFCNAEIEVEPGVGGTGFSLTVSGTPESYFGADDGSASAVATGGSGQFTFVWSNGATTPNITGLAAGIYTVTVVDSIGACTRVDTAIVDAGEKITLTVGAGSGCQGQIISIPVTVDNFFDVTGFIFTVHVNEDTVGTILGVTNGSVHPGIVDSFSANLLPNNDLAVNWSDSSLNLPNGTVLFRIDVQLGMAVVGSVSPIVIAGSPSILQFTQDSSGQNVVSMIVIGNDTISITCEQGDNVEIGGDIQTWRPPTFPVPGVDVMLTGGTTANQTTGVPGTYLFSVPGNTNTTVKCFKETIGLDGLTGADVLLIKRHVLNIQLLTSPYQFVAADVSADGNLSLIDYARIQQVALGLQEHITGSPDWKFVPKSYVFPTPPLSAPFPDSISHLPATASFLDDDFVAVRMGDVNGSIDPTDFTNDDVFDRAGALRIRIEDRIFQAGETFQVSFKASGFKDYSGFQMTLRFDPNMLALEAVKPGALPDMSDANFGAMRADEGLLTTLWVNAIPMTLADGDVLFTLTFKALRDGASLAEVLYPGSDITRAEGYDRDGNAMQLDFEFVQPRTGQVAATFALYQNQPNPFTDRTTIGFVLPEACEAQLRVFDASGKMLAERKGQYTADRHQEAFDLGGVSGVLYYELVTPFGTLARKMTLME